MTSTHTTVPEVKGALFDTYLPAAVASLASTITVGTTTVELRKPQIYYGRPASPAVDRTYILIGPTAAGDSTPPVTFPNTSTRSRSEAYDVELFIFYSLGDVTSSAQRIATESGYAVFRAIADQIKNNPNLGGVIPAGGHALVTQVTDQEYDMAEGRGVGLICSVSVTGRI